MTIAFRSFFLSFCFTAGSLSAAAQADSVASFGNSQLIAHQTAGNGELVLTKEGFTSFKWWRTDLLTGENQLLDSFSSYYYPDNIAFNAGGAFYICKVSAPNGNGDHYYLSYLDTAGQKLVYADLDGLVPGSAQVSPDDYTLVSEGTYYAVIRNGTENFLLQSDGTTAGTQIVSSVTGTIVGMAAMSGSLVLAVKTGTDVGLYRYLPANGTTQLFRTFPDATNFSSFFYAGEDGTNSYFTLQLVAGYSSCWKTDLTTAGTQLFIDSLRVVDIRFSGDTFLLRTGGDGNGLRYLEGTVSDPQNYTEVAFETTLSSPDVQVDQLFGNGYLRVLSNRFGIEVGHFKADGTIGLVKDLAPGPAPGLQGTSLVMNGFYDIQFPSAPGPDSSLYAIMTNGLDTNRYFYRIQDTLTESLFPINLPEQLGNVFVEGHYLYWFRQTDSDLRIERYNLELPPVPQEGVIEDSTETWFRELAYPSGNYFWGSAPVGDYAVAAKLDADGGVLVAFTLRYLENRLLISSAEPDIDTLEGATVLVKLDRYGKMAWNSSFGDHEMIFRGDPKLETDSDGNILVAGNYFQNAAFGTDSMVSARSGYFLAKIDGQTGAILWKKKIAETYYTNGLVVEGLALDADDNIYLALLYDDFYLEVDGMSVTSPIGPVNAAARFSPDGHIQWLKNMRTPWTDYYGNTQFFAFDKAHEKLVAAQSQGFYNTSSSCNYHSWEYFIQTLDPDGTLLDTFGFSGTDLGGLATGFIDAGGQFEGFGYYRDRLKLGEFNAASPPFASCYANEGFYFRYDPGMSKIVAAGTSEGGPFYPMDAHTSGGYVYVYGTDDNDELVLVKLKQNGEEIGYKPLGQKADAFEFGFNQRFDVRDSFLVFLGIDFVKNVQYDVRPLFLSTPAMAVLKIRDADWQTDKTWFNGLQLPALAGDPESLVFFPNPFTGELTISSGADTFPWEAFELFDMNGRKMTGGAFTELAFQQLDLGQLTAGMYLIRMTGGGKTHTERILKLNP